MFIKERDGLLRRWRMGNKSIGDGVDKVVDSMSLNGADGASSRASVIGRFAKIDLVEHEQSVWAESVKLGVRIGPRSGGIEDKQDERG